MAVSRDKGPREPQVTAAAQHCPKPCKLAWGSLGTYWVDLKKSLKDKIIYHNKIFSSARTPGSTLRVMAKVMHILNISFTGTSKALRKEHSGLQHQFS